MGAVDRDLDSVPVRELREFFHRRHQSGDVGDVTNYQNLGAGSEMLLVQSNDLVDARRWRGYFELLDLDAVFRG